MGRERNRHRSARGERAVDAVIDREERADAGVHRIFHRITEIGRLAHDAFERRAAGRLEVDGLRPDRDVDFAVGKPPVCQWNRQRSQRDVAFRRVPARERPADAVGFAHKTSSL